MSKYIVGSLTIAQITEDSLLHEVDKALRSREAFTDNEVGMNERIYNADVFDAIINDHEETKKMKDLAPKHFEKFGMSDKAIAQLEELNDQTVEFNYVMIINCK